MPTIMSKYYNGEGGSFRTVFKADIQFSTNDQNGLTKSGIGLSKVAGSVLLVNVRGSIDGLWSMRDESVLTLI